MLGQYFTHRYTERRERRADLARTVDAAIAAFMAGDRAVSRLISQVEAQQEQDAVQAAADRVENHEVAMRAAVVSIQMRVPSEAPLGVRFAAASRAFTDVYLSLGTVIANKDLGLRMVAVMKARQNHVTYHGTFSDALDEARRHLS